eukprot:3938426-Rhodomonas_salina.6
MEDGWEEKASRRSWEEGEGRGCKEEEEHSMYSCGSRRWRGGGGAAAAAAAAGAGQRWWWWSRGRAEEEEEERRGRGGAGGGEGGEGAQKREGRGRGGAGERMQRGGDAHVRPRGETVWLDCDGKPGVTLGVNWGLSAEKKIWNKWS